MKGENMELINKITSTFDMEVTEKKYNYILWLIIIQNIIISIACGIISPLMIRYMGQLFSQNQLSYILLVPTIIGLFQVMMNKIENKKISLWGPYIFDLCIITPICFGLLIIGNLKIYLLWSATICDGILSIMYYHSQETFREISKTHYNLTKYANVNASCMKIGALIGLIGSFIANSHNPIHVLIFINIFILFGLTAAMLGYSKL